MSIVTPIDRSILSSRLTITVSEFTTLTGLGRTTAFALMKTGELTRIHVGRRSLIAAASVIRLLEPKPMEQSLGGRPTRLVKRSARRGA